MIKRFKTGFICEEAGAEGGAGGGSATPTQEPNRPSSLPISPPQRSTEPQPTPQSTPQAPAQTPAAGEQKPGEGPQTPAPNSFDPNAISKGVVDGLKPMFEQMNRQPEKQYSQEEIDQITRRWRANPEILSQLFGGDDGADPDKQLAALNAISEGTVTHALTMAQALIEQRLAPVLEMLNGVQGHVAQTTSQQATQQFFAAYPGLEKHQDVTKMVAQQLQNENFPSMQARMEAIATRTETLIKEFNPNFSAKAGVKQQQTQSSTPASQIPGGQGGAGGNPQSAGPLSPQQRAVAALK